MLVLIAAILVGVWIYLVLVLRKKKFSLFHYQVEQRLAERSLKRLKVFLLAAGISFAAGFAGFIAADVLYGSSEIQVPVFDYIIIVVLSVFAVATIGGLVILLKGRQKQDKADVPPPMSCDRSSSVVLCR